MGKALLVLTAEQQAAFDHNVLRQLIGSNHLTAATTPSI
jgi:hypothetical protein